MSNPIQISSDKAHYPNQLNNGYRAEWLQHGVINARIINAAIAGDKDALIDYAKHLAGLTQPKTWATSAIKKARSFKQVPDYKVCRYSNGGKMVFRPELSWRYSGNKQVARIEWMPLFGTSCFGEIEDDMSF